MTLTETNTFLGEDFLLESDAARTLYHDYAKDLPIIDYHCHLPPEEIALDRQFEHLTAIWLDGDHYKWRAMRTLGIDEKYITGNADPKDKFRAWAKCVPYTMRNPLYHWSHLELQRYFDLDVLISEDTADYIYDACTEKLASPDFRVRSLLRRMRVETVCTTDDPTDDLQNHTALAGESFAVKVLPAFRPDKALQIDQPDKLKPYLEKLSEQSSLEINSYATLVKALENRMDYFHQRGCRLSDHGLERIYTAEVDPEVASKIFAKYMNGDELASSEIEAFRSVLLIDLCKGYHKRQWVQQFHLGALRNTNTRMEHILGPDTGFDSIGDFQQASSLARFLDQLDQQNQLAKTILYNLNPGDNEVLATMIGNFNDGSIRGKMQFGSGWWYLDQKQGMEAQMDTLSNMGLLSCFVGMLTDSRSFLSYPRHEYFRRILCNLFGSDIEKGLLPHDLTFIGGIVEDICYRNAKSYFDFDAVSITI